MLPPQKIRVGVFALLAIFLIAAVVWWQRSDSTGTTKAPPTQTGKTAKSPPAVATDQPALTLGPITQHQAANELSAQLTKEGLPPQERLQAVSQLLYVYRQGFGGNPVGQNDDIVAAMLGENEKRTAFLPKDCPVIQGGKLVDEWGTPYWFHPITSNEMEIRSAGPDKALFTSDDITLD